MFQQSESEPLRSAPHSRFETAEALVYQRNVAATAMPRKRYRPGTPGDRSLANRRASSFGQRQRHSLGDITPGIAAANMPRQFVNKVLGNRWKEAATIPCDENPATDRHATVSHGHGFYTIARNTDIRCHNSCTIAAAGEGHQDGGRPLSSTIGGFTSALWHAASNQPREANDRCSKSSGGPRGRHLMDDWRPSAWEGATTAT